MRRKWKNELKKAFEAPPPMRKEKFLEGLSSGTKRDKAPPFEITLAEFVLTQAGYIRGWVWAVSVLVFLTAMMGAVVLSEDMLWEIAALTPFLALVAVAESARSENYGMAEIEMATRFSLKSVVLARLGILGAENLLLLCLLLPLGMRNNPMEPIQAGVYMVLPFLLTTYSGTCIVRRIRGREGMYLCGVAAVCVSFGSYSVRQESAWIFRADVMGWWIVCGVLLTAGIIKQYAYIVRQAREGIRAA